MLENLFAQTHQEQTFLGLAACGFIFGGMLHLSTMARRWRRAAGIAGDAVCMTLLTTMLCTVLVQSGAGVRGYGLLGVIIGALLYYAGFSRLVETASRSCAGLWKRIRKTASPKEGFSLDDAEIITTDDSVREE